MSNERFGKINARVIERVTNLALYGLEDAEIIETVGGEIDERTVTTRWIKFIANQARREMEAN